MSNSPTDYRFPKQAHLRRPAEFARIYAGQVRAGDRHLLVFGQFSPGEVTRAGLSVSKKHGNAVARNRLKRLLREAFRLERHHLPPGLEMILIPRRDSGASLADYRASLVGCARRLRKRLDAERGLEKE